MYELLLNAAKVLVSKEARDAGKSLLNLIQSSPEWKKDICTLVIRIDSDSREQATLIRELSARKLTTLRYPDSVIEAFQSIYVELVTNAFEYGLVNGWWHKGKIEIEAEIVDSYVALVVRNTKGIRFDFREACEEQYRRLMDDPRSRRGTWLSSALWLVFIIHLYPSV